MKHSIKATFVEYNVENALNIEILYSNECKDNTMTQFKDQPIWIQTPENSSIAKKIHTDIDTLQFTNILHWYSTTVVKKDQDHPEAEPAEPSRRVTIIGNNYRRITNICCSTCGIQPPKSPDGSIWVQRGNLFGDSTKPKTECLSFPASFLPYSGNILENWMQESGVVILVLESFDIREECFKHLVNAAEKLGDKSKLCLLFSRDIPTVNLRTLLGAAQKTFHTFWYTTGVVWDTKKANELVRDFVEKVGDWDSIGGVKKYVHSTHSVPWLFQQATPMRHQTSTQPTSFPVFSKPSFPSAGPFQQATPMRHQTSTQPTSFPVFSKPSFPSAGPLASKQTNVNLTTSMPLSRPTVSFPSDQQVRSSPLSGSLNDIPVLGQVHRDRAVAFLVKTLSECKQSPEIAKRIEEDVFNASEGVLQEYVSTLCHQRIILQASVDQNQEVASTGKRRREIDNLGFEANKKRFTTIPSYHWFYTHPEIPFEIFFEQPDFEEDSSYAKVPESIGDILESKFRDEESNFNVDIPEIGPCFINLTDMSFKADGYLGKLQRKVFYKGDEITVPRFLRWKEYQDSMLYRESVDLTEDYFALIKKRVEDDIEGAVVTNIVRIQNLEQYRNFETEAHRISVNNQNPTDLATRFYGSCVIPPQSISASKNGIPLNIPDPDPNQNWGSGIHVAENSWFADERAYTIRDPQTGFETKKIFLVLVAVGKATKIECDTTLKRPPQSVVLNHMPIYYDSVSGEYQKNDKKTNVYVVYKQTQVLPLYEIEYSIQPMAERSGFEVV